MCVNQWRKPVIDPPACLAAAEETRQRELIYGVTTEILKVWMGRNEKQKTGAPHVGVGDFRHLVSVTERVVFPGLRGELETACRKRTRTVFQAPGLRNVRSHRRARAHCLEPIFYMCGCVCRGRLTLTRKPYNKKPPLIHPFTFATPLLASFFLFLFSPLPSHPFTPPFEHANVCNTRLFLVLVSFGYTHTHIYILALQRWVCELGQRRVYFSSGQCSRQLPLLFIVGGWMERGGKWGRRGGKGVSVGAVGVAVGEAAATNRGRQMDGSHLPERSKARSADMAYVPPPPTQISSSGSPLSSPAVLLFLFSRFLLFLLFLPLFLSSSGLTGAGMWPC